MPAAAAPPPDTHPGGSERAAVQGGQHRRLTSTQAPRCCPRSHLHSSCDSLDFLANESVTSQTPRDLRGSESDVKYGLFEPRLDKNLNTFFSSFLYQVQQRHQRKKATKRE